MITNDRKRMLATLSCRLNGEPAKISNSCGQFATVATIWAPHVESEFSWEAVERVTDKGGLFIS